MPKTAILFTGQGAQSPGMGKDIAAACAPAAEVFDRANEVVGYDLRTLCFEGPAERLEQTDIQQPAIFTTSVAIWRAMNEGRDLPEPPVAMAGLSLGEYTALHAAGALSFEDALRLVKRRGELMQAAAASVAGGMVSALGLDTQQVEDICRQAGSAGMIRPANFNSPGQIVLSGTKAACEAVVPLIEQAGGRAIPLKVAGAFHSPIMRPAAEGLAEVLAKMPIQPPPMPVIANVNCQPHGDPATIRACLTAQLTEAVLWQASIEKMLADGVARFIEVGPGRVLTGLLKKISRRTPVVNVSTANDLASLQTVLK
ncbi:MAG TPA: ACP S-malonyltransferase [Phycisphaerae bacterium]|nr:ACP S-malonyltransferase [Phycisphaerae bacterium]